jgi:hypothetical protein
MDATLINQALVDRFGDILCRELKSGEWTQWKWASAWVRRSGVEHLRESIDVFMASGGRICGIVGVDLGNTTKEGLEELLAISQNRNAEFYVHHNEAEPTFHPKVYLFSGSDPGDECKIMLGSNNLTKAGLYLNTEASVQFSCCLNERLPVQIISAFASWKDESSGLARPLTQELIDLLVEGEYVETEAAVRRRFAADKTTGIRNQASPLFGRRHFPAPKSNRTRDSRQVADPMDERELPRDNTTAQVTLVNPAASMRISVRGTTVSATATLVMQLRLARGTQTQLPINLAESGFFTNNNIVISGHTNEQRPIIATHAERGRGSVNTYKLEMPEARGHRVIFARFDRTEGGTIYHIFPAGTPGAAELRRFLGDGLEDPRSTLATTPTTPWGGTLLRFM